MTVAVWMVFGAAQLNWVHRKSRRVPCTLSCKSKTRKQFYKAPLFCKTLQTRHGCGATTRSFVGGVFNARVRRRYVQQRLLHTAFHDTTHTHTCHCRPRTRVCSMYKSYSWFATQQRPLQKRPVSVTSEGEKPESEHRPPPPLKSKETTTLHCRCFCPPLTNLLFTDKAKTSFTHVHMLPKNLFPYRIISFNT